MTAFISYLFDTAEFEDPTGKETADALHTNARNILKLLFAGTALVPQDGQSSSKSQLTQPVIKDALLNRKNPELMAALREEIQYLLDRACYWLNDPSNAGNEPEIAKYQQFLQYLLGQYPFTDPDDTTTLCIPTRIRDTWEHVAYHVEPIDISPTKGPLAWVHEPEDKIYAYGLTTNIIDTPNYLLLMGTTYPAGQGSAFSNLYNIKPHHAIGEGHSFTQLGTWLEKQDDKDVIVTGHSKGGTMAMIAAARWPEKIRAAVCLSPAGLSYSALKHYEKQRLAQSSAQRVPIDIVINEGDIVPYIDSGFYADAKIVRFKLDPEKRAFNFGYPRFIQKIVRFYEAHLLHFANREPAVSESVPTSSMNHQRARHFLDALRWTVSWLLFPVQYIGLFVTIVYRKVERFCHDPDNFLWIMVGLMALGMIAVIALTQVALGLLILQTIFNAFLFLNLTEGFAFLFAMIVYSSLCFVPLLTCMLLDFVIPKIGNGLQIVSTGVAIAVGVIIGSLAGLARMLCYSAPKVDEVSAEFTALISTPSLSANPELVEPVHSDHPVFGSSDTIALDSIATTNNKAGFTNNK